ncbi:MAG: NAD(P)H-binding protein [Acetobacteraceae bacterium]
MGQASETIAVFGGTGFLGRRVARRLAARGFRVRVASRHLGPAQPLFGGGETRVTEIEADIRDERQIVAALVGAHGAVNAVGLYIERGNDTFRSVHVEAAARLARLCRERGLRRLSMGRGHGARSFSRRWIGSCPGRSW